VEAIREFEVPQFGIHDLTVTVAVDSQGASIHTTRPAEWQARIAQSLPGTAVLQ
jgi:fumarate hydratase class I